MINTPMHNNDDDGERSLSVFLACLVRTACLRNSEILRFSEGSNIGRCDILNHVCAGRNRLEAGVIESDFIPYQLQGM